MEEENGAAALGKPSASSRSETACTGTKRKRRAEDRSAAAAADDDDPFCLMAELPRNAIQHILSFQAHRDRLPLAATSKGMRDEIEIYSESALTKLKTKHRVDETFDARIRDQSNIVTTRSKPVELPSRYLLWAGKKAHLYKLMCEPPPGGVYYPACNGLALSPSGTRIMISEKGHTSNGHPCLIVHVLDCSTKQRLQIIEHVDMAAFDYADVFWFGDLIVTCSSSVIRVWTETGQLKHEHRIDQNCHTFSLTRHNQDLVYMTGFDKIHRLNVQTGVLATNALPETMCEKFEGVEWFKIFVCDGKWLILDIVGELHNGVFVSSMFSIDLCDYSIKQEIEGHPDKQFKQSSDCSTMIYGLSMDSSPLVVDTFEIVDGCFLPRLSYQVSVEIDQILTVHESNFVAEFQNGHKLGVFNAENGELERSMDLPPGLSPCIAENSSIRQELFVHMAPRNTGNDDWCIAAYSLMET